MPMPETEAFHEIGGIEYTPFPAARKQSVGLVNEVITDVTSIYFADKIMVTISQGGRLSQWINVPLSTASPTTVETTLPSFSKDMLPPAHLSPKTLLGGGGEQRESLGHLCALQIATMITTQNPEEKRTVVVGLGLAEATMSREGWFDILDLLQKSIKNP